jgi:hypothetical protein
LNSRHIRKADWFANARFYGSGDLQNARTGAFTPPITMLDEMEAKLPEQVATARPDMAVPRNQKSHQRVTVGHQYTKNASPTFTKEC